MAAMVTSKITKQFSEFNEEYEILEKRFYEESKGIAWLRIL